MPALVPSPRPDDDLLELLARSMYGEPHILLDAEQTRAVADVAEVFESWLQSDTFHEGCAPREALDDAEREVRRLKAEAGTPAAEVWTDACNAIGRGLVALKDEVGEGLAGEIVKRAIDGVRKVRERGPTT